ncbi:MAG: hypothetical protein ACK5H2_11240 [Beutenbergiaceae bacterium]
MPPGRSEISTASAGFWFGLSVLVVFVNFRSATRGSWLALLLGVLALYFAYRYGKVLLERYRAGTRRRR